MSDPLSIAVLVPCYQEAVTIGKVVRDFARELPGATVYVYDNNSTDTTAAEARAAGAVVRREKRQGKGFVVASMLEQVDADVYVMVDGDDTYAASGVHALLEPILAGRADMVVGRRREKNEANVYRPFHIFGNRLVSWLINRIFKSDIRDLFSGYRVFTRELAKSVPIVSRGFDVETELTLQSLYRQFVIVEVDTPYGARPEGSQSKLRTLPDGFRVLTRVFVLFQSYKPLTFFGLCGLALTALALVMGFRPVQEYVREGYVYSVPRAILAAGLVTVAVVCGAVGIILNSVNYRLQEVERILVKRARPPYRNPSA